MVELMSRLIHYFFYLFLKARYFFIYPTQDQIIEIAWRYIGSRSKNPDWKFYQLKAGKSHFCFWAVVPLSSKQMLIDAVHFNNEKMIMGGQLVPYDAGLIPKSGDIKLGRPVLYTSDGIVEIELRRRLEQVLETSRKSNADG